ncbi:MAG: rhomboid family intramembrane serine protease [Bacteroidetes bacterium]|nr:rhomboid family intramembrane serine protease [Bacteroidota bacterium]
MTIVLIIITSVISIISFGRPGFMLKMQFNPYQVYHRKEYYRLFSHAFLHADWMHLIINMIVLFSFGTTVEQYFKQLSMAGLVKNPEISFLILYAGGILFSTTTTLFKHKEDIWYNSIGASGAVSAVVFTSIFFAPLNKLFLYFIPLPGIIAGLLYLGYSQYMSKKGKDNINHDAHFLGAIFGFIFPVFIDPGLIKLFVQQLGF